MFQRVRFHKQMFDENGYEFNLSFKFSTHVDNFFNFANEIIRTMLKTMLLEKYRERPSDHEIAISRNTSPPRIGVIVLDSVGFFPVVALVVPLRAVTNETPSFRELRGLGGSFTAATQDTPLVTGCSLNCSRHRGNSGAAATTLKVLA